MPYAIRRATLAEAARLGSFAAELFREAYGPTHPEPTLSWYLAESFAEGPSAARLGDPARTVLVVEDDAGDWLGYAELRMGAPDVDRVAATRPLPASPLLEVVRFYVASRYHGRGIAQALMSACEKVATDAGCGAVWLQAWQEAPQALRFYQKSGFEIHGTAVFHFGAHVDHDYLLVKDLRGGAPVDETTA